MVPEITNPTVAKIIEAFEDDEFFIELNHPEGETLDGDAVVAAFAHDTNTTTKTVITDGPEIIEVDPHGDNCSHCDNNEDREPLFAAPMAESEAYYREGYCRHAAVAVDCVTDRQQKATPEDDQIEVLGPDQLPSRRREEVHPPRPKE